MFLCKYCANKYELYQAIESRLLESGSIDQTRVSFSFGVILISFKAIEYFINLEK